MAVRIRAHGPLPMAALREAIASVGVHNVGLPFMAGHDAAILAQSGVPCGMLFVRSLAHG